MTINRLISCVLLGLCGAIAGAAETPSPARAQLEDFLAAFNSGDRAKIEAFGRDHAPPNFVEASILDQTMQMFATTGGLDLLEVEQSSPHALRSRVRERRTGSVQRLVIEIDPATPDRIIVIQLTTTDSPPLVRGKEPD